MHTTMYKIDTQIYHRHNKKANRGTYIYAYKI